MPNSRIRGGYNPRMMHGRNPYGRASSRRMNNRNMRNLNRMGGNQILDDYRYGVPPHGPDPPKFVY